MDAKNAKVSAYRENLPRCEQWLLLIIGTHFRSAIWSAVVSGHSVLSGFDRTFCIDAYEGKTFEVETRRP